MGDDGIGCNLDYIAIQGDGVKVRRCQEQDAGLVTPQLRRIRNTMYLVIVFRSNIDEAHRGFALTIYGNLIPSSGTLIPSSSFLSFESVDFSVF